LPSALIVGAQAKTTPVDPDHALPPGPSRPSYCLPGRRPVLARRAQLPALLHAHRHPRRHDPRLVRRQGHQDLGGNQLVQHLAGKTLALWTLVVVLGGPADVAQRSLATALSGGSSLACRVAAEIKAFGEQPIAWLKSGPGKERADNPGWTTTVKPSAKSSQTINILLTPDGQRLVMTLLQLLAPYPEARRLSLRPCRVE
jgi:hypothetical protein